MPRVGIWWRGEVLDVPLSSNFKEFCRHLCATLDIVDEKSLVVISGAGQEITDETFEELARQDRILFVYDVASIGSYANSFVLPEFSPQFDCMNKLPSPGSATSSMDDQIEQLEKRSKSILVSFDSLYKHLLKVLECAKVLDTTHFVLMSSLAAAQKNFQFHCKAIREQTFELERASVDVFTKMTALLNRCPMDFALLKVIPIIPEIMGEANSLFDFGGQQWYADYTFCIAEKDQIAGKLDSLQTLVKKIDTSIQNCASFISDAQDERSLTRKISVLVEQLQNSINRIKSVLKDEEPAVASSENLLLLHKSSRLLNLAEISNEYNESVISSIYGSVNDLVNQCKDKQSLIFGEFEHTSQKLQALVYDQECLVECVDHINDIHISLQSFQKYSTTLEAIHAYPVAYFALLCELVRRNNFISLINQTFNEQEQRFSQILEMERQKRSQFVQEISKIMDTSKINPILLQDELDARVLFVVNGEYKMEISTLEEFERIIAREEQSLERDQPMKAQLQRFLETIVHMRKRCMVDLAKPVANCRENTPPRGPAIFRQIIPRELSPAKSTVGSPDSADLIGAYETRIKNLERLLQESYAAAKGAIVEKQSAEQDTKTLTQSIMKIQSDGEWQHALLDVLYELSIDSSAVHSATDAKKRIIDKMNLINTTKLCIKNFQVGDVVLFLPTIRTGIWSIFNIGSPNYYLSKESLDTMQQTSPHSDWIIGRIVAVDPKISTGKKTNPFRLAAGFDYFEVHAELETE